MKSILTIAFLFMIASGCVYTPRCTHPPSGSMDGPVSLVLLPGNVLYVVNSNADSRYCSSYISMLSLSVPQQPSYSGTIPITYKNDNVSLVAGTYFSPSTGLLWLADRENNRVLLFDVSSSTVTSAIPVDQDPISIAPIGTIDGDMWMLVCDLSSNDVSVVSSAQQKELYRIPLTNNGIGTAPLHAVVTPSPVSINNQPPDRYAYITRGADNNLSVVSINDHCEFNPMFPSSASVPVFDTATPGNTATMSSVRTYDCQTPSELWTASFTSATSDFVVSGSVSGRMKERASVGVPYTSDNGYVGFTIFRPSEKYVVGDNFTFYTTASSGLINIPNMPGTGVGTANPVTRDIVMTPDMQKVFASYVGLDSVIVIDPSDNTIENYIKVGKSPEAMLLSPDGSTLYVACYNSAKIYVIDTNTESVTNIVGVGNGPFAMALSPDQHYLYVLNYTDNSLGVVDLTDFALVYTLK
ncbi:MAG: hypothetical protein M1491_02995 [Deltaproteobacteria bacterium]|nr:hypothetical protein [Deltaproteobacteria bacterium]MCL5276683.1 hypothetical protein [Deltaproteobacteria bacterium]